MLCCIVIDEVSLPIYNVTKLLSANHDDDDDDDDGDLGYFD
jgi:hypothetical protein